MPNDEEITHPEEARGYLGPTSAGLGLLKKPKKKIPKRDPVSTSVLGQRAAERGTLAPESITSPLRPAGPVPIPPPSPAPKRKMRGTPL